LAQHSDDDDHEEAPKKDDIPAELFNANGIPQITFRNAHDHMAHTGIIVDQEASRIKFKRIKTTKGPFCMEDDWVVLRYKMYSQLDG